MRASSLRVLAVATMTLVAWAGEPRGLLAEQAGAPTHDSTQPRQSPPPGAQDVIIGVWRLNLAKSTYSPGPPPRAEIRTYEEEHEGLRATIATTQADGRTTVVEYLASFNEDTFPLAGSAEIDAIGLRTIDAYTSEVILSAGGKVIGHARRVIAPDRKTMTVTVERWSAVGPVKIVAVYERVQT